MDTAKSARWEMVEAGGRTAQSFGLNRLLGQIYMFLYLSDDAQSLDELSSHLGVSKASVSIASRQLESWGAVRRVWKKGDRKDYYEAEGDFGRILNNGLLSSLTKKLDSAKTQIEICQEMLNRDGSDDEEVAHIRNKLESAEKYRARIVKVIDNPLIRKIFS